MDRSDPMVDLFLSGKAHVYYGLLAIAGVSLAVFLGASPLWLLAVFFITGMIFTDLWCHWYAH